MRREITLILKEPVTFMIANLFLGFLTGVVITAMILQYIQHEQNLSYKRQIAQLCLTYGRYHWVCAENGAEWKR